MTSLSSVTSVDLQDVGVAFQLPASHQFLLDVGGGALPTHTHRVGLHDRAHQVLVLRPHRLG